MCGGIVCCGSVDAAWSWVWRCGGSGGGFFTGDDEERGSEHDTSTTALQLVVGLPLTAGTGARGCWSWSLALRQLVTVLLGLLLGTQAPSCGFPLSFRPIITKLRLKDIHFTNRLTYDLPHTYVRIPAPRQPTASTIILVQNCHSRSE